MDRENDDQPNGWKSIYANNRDARQNDAEAEGEARDSAFDEEEIASEATAVRRPSAGGASAAAERGFGKTPSPDVGYPREFQSPQQAGQGRKRAAGDAPEEKEKSARPVVRRRKKGHPVLWSFLIAVGLVVVAAGSVLLYVWNGFRPPKASDTPVRFTIAKGMSAKEVAAQLQQDGLIRNSFLFSVWMKLRSEGSGFQAGDYDIKPGMTREEIVAMLDAGNTVAADTIKFTIPEGFTVMQIADRLAQAGYVDKDAFVQAMGKPDQITGSVWTKDIPQDADLRYPLEGYLFPETYEFKKGATATEIINRMASELDVKLNELPDDWQTAMDELGLNMHQVLTIASLVEREVVIDDERPIVAGVIENRLKKKMPLQIDATIQYLLDKQKEKLTTDDLKVDSPYNTYLHTGLPPGPIANPSLKSIEAVLYPADTDYLYYVTKKDGSNEHLFATTYSQHQKNIQQSEKNEKNAQSQKK